MVNMFEINAMFNWGSNNSEGVWRVVDDVDARGTFNYVNPGDFDSVENPVDWFIALGGYIGHFVLDVLPFWAWGNNRDDQ